MAVALFMDHHVPRAITIGLRLRAVDVLTAHEDKSNELADTLLLDRALALQRVLFTQDDDLLAEARDGRDWASLSQVSSTRTNYGERSDSVLTI
jgi:hypothetical protein